MVIKHVDIHDSGPSRARAQQTPQDATSGPRVPTTHEFYTLRGSLASWESQRASWWKERCGVEHDGGVVGRRYRGPYGGNGGGGGGVGGGSGGNGSGRDDRLRSSL